MSIEAKAKASFAKVFSQWDAPLFKEMADGYFARAATLRKRDVDHFPDHLRLRARNIQKRLLLGVGVELLLKAVYLRYGFAINRPTGGPQGVRFPFPLAGSPDLSPNETYQLNVLIQCLHHVDVIGDLGDAEIGLRVAKVYRNKEGHVVTKNHVFDPREYREIEKSLVEVYRRAFGERLDVRIAMEPRKRGRWRARSLT